MIQVDKALELIASSIFKMEPVMLPLAEVQGMTLAFDTYSPINLPSFRNSAMDGYAVMLNSCNSYTLNQELKAGDSAKIRLKAGEATRVFTGAAVPENADTVIIQEWAQLDGNTVKFIKKPKKYANIRSEGEQLKSGELVFKSGLVLNEASIGLLAGLGIAKVEVYATPKVGILVTGNELQQPGKTLKPGCIYESNSIMLELALKKAGVDQITKYRVKDDFLRTKQAIEKALDQNDLLLISGGISVGDYDFVKKALLANHINEVFYMVKQKPGKPLWFGKKDKKIVFALPGNPASSLSCFYVYVLPAIRKMTGKKFRANLKTAISAERIFKPAGKTFFQKAKVEDGKLSILKGQSSSMLHSFAVSNALACIPENVEEIPENGEVEYFELDL
ncbi:molybdopterin molybdochelatase [Salegentibacter sp. 24]|uniref:molybdopterin molybdotransferase MoeA n=1 Tax=Salegentibacter sp. 24 TaxID=2183986 RepID=UPI00106192A9|nr:gephyrin-like molybdotransferase Glp [Salegentibacter sp. 24]TDN86363.1 molybdopterin molybdochelatase [Salegentibacter sp. 24]